MTLPVALTLLVAALLVPSANIHTYDGFPLSTLPEFLTFVLVLPVLVSRSLRRLYGRWFRECPRPGRALIVGALATATGLKLLLLASGTHEGFLACYTSPVESGESRTMSWALTEGRCEVSYENPLRRFGATRLDRVLAFEERDWNLSFFNSVRFNIYPSIPGNLVRSRLPFRAIWTGSVSLPPGATVEAQYVGEAQVRSGDRVISLPPRYGEFATVPVPILAGTIRPITVDYRFDDGARVGLPVRGPGASFRLFVGGATGASRSPSGLTSAPAPLPWRVLGLVIDAILVASSVALGVLHARLMRRDAPLVTSLAGLTLAAGLYEIAIAPLPGGGSLLVVAGACLPALLTRPWRRRLVLAYMCCVLASLLRMVARMPSLATVLYREAGDDPLSYESFGRSILETWTLEAGESIFLHTPAFRYLVFLGHLLLGDGQALINVVAVALFNLAVLVLAARFCPRGARSRPATAFVFLTAAALLVLVNAAPIVAHTEWGLSEGPTWITLPFAFALLFTTASPRRNLLGTALLGVSFLIRPNHAPAIALIMAVFLVTAARRRPRVALGATLLFGLMSLLPAAHNLHYGGRLVFLQSRPEARIEPVYRPRLFEFQPAALLGIWRDREVQTVVRKRVGLLLYAGTSQDARTRAAMRGLQLAWVAALVAAVVRWRHRSWSSTVLLAVPLLYLGPHLFYALEVYYPRHIVAGQIAMGVVAIASVSRHGQPRREPPEEPESG